MPNKNTALSTGRINRECIKSIRYPGEVGFQKGKYVVSAIFPGIKNMGGAIVAEFKKVHHALKCAKKIVDVNPSHAPMVSKMDWKGYRDKTILSSKGKTPDQVTREIKRRTKKTLR